MAELFRAVRAYRDLRDRYLGHTTATNAATAEYLHRLYEPALIRAAADLTPPSSTDAGISRLIELIEGLHDPALQLAWLDLFPLAVFAYVMPSPPAEGPCPDSEPLSAGDDEYI